MNFLLDTCLLSELYKGKPDPGVIEWIASIKEERLFVSTLSLGEIQKGVSKLRDGRRRQSIQTWLDQSLRQRFGERALPVDVEIALEWGHVCGTSEKEGTPLAVIDSLLAATAVCRNLTLVTRNERDFAIYSLKMLNPWNGG